MRKIFTLLTLCLLATTAWGQTVITFTPGDPAGANQSVSGPDEMSKDGITVKSTNGAFNAAQFRFGKNTTTTITSTVGNITQIVFECTKDNPATGFDEGQNIVVDGYNGTWTGNSSEITLTSNVKQVRATKITFTVGGSGLANPSITPAAGTYYNPIEVTITCGTAGATIYYTTNGTDPTTASTRYTAPFTLSSNATVKAISAKDGKTSDVVSAAYEFGTATAVANIAAFQNATVGDVVTFTNPVNVLAQNGRYLFVKDNSGYALFYGTPNQTYKNGDVIPAGFAGTTAFYNGEPELTNLTGFQAASGNSPIAAVYPFSAANVNHDHFGNFVAFKNATITVDEEGKNYTLTDENGNQCAIYFGSMGVSVPTDLTAKYNIEAIVGSYGKDNVVYQLLPTKVEKVGGDDPQPGEGYGLGELGDVADNATVTMKYDATVLGQKGNYLYLKDQTGFGLVYGSAGQTYTLGDVIPAGFGGTKTTYDMEPEIKNPTGFAAAKSNIGGRDALEAAAEVITIGQAAHETWGHYVKINNVTINTTDKTLTDATGTLGYYDRFGDLSWPEDLSKSYTIYAIVGTYKTVYQLLPTRIVFTEEDGQADCLADAYAYNTGKRVHFNKPLTAIYQNGQNLYVKDACGEYGLVYGSVEGTFTNGDIINDALASWTTYSGNKQLSPVAESFVVAGHGEAVAPEMLPVEELATDLVHWYLRTDDVTITLDESDATGKTYLMTDETGTVKLYNRFGIDIPTDGDAHNVWSFLTVYKNEVELYAISIDVDPDQGGDDILTRYDVNKDGEINVADVNTLIDYILTGNGFHDCNLDGEMNVADVNALIDYILNH